MIAWVEATNEFVKQYEALVTATGLPILTLLVTWMINLASARRAKRTVQAERKLAVELKLSDYRQAWINDLRSEFERFLRAAADAGLNPEQAAEEMRTAIFGVTLRMNNSDENFKPLFLNLESVLEEVIESYVSDKKFETGKLNKAAQICSKVLKTEWEVLKRNLESAANG